MKKKERRHVLTTGKRKTAVARAAVNPGMGKVWINKIPLDIWEPKFSRVKIREPLIISGELSKQVDIRVNVKYGGVSSQADAVRKDIAKGMVEFFKDENLKKAYIDQDRNLLVYDSRRTEPHKPSRSKKGARRHKQRSKR